MRFFRDNLLAQFSILSLIIIVVIAVSSITILTIRLDRDLELLNEHGTAMMAGTMISPADPFSIPSLVLQRRFLNLPSSWSEIAPREERPQGWQAREQVAMEMCSRSFYCEPSL